MSMSQRDWQDLGSVLRAGAKNTWGVQDAAAKHLGTVLQVMADRCLELATATADGGVPEVPASELFPEGRVIYYEGDDPDWFRAEIRAEFGFDPGDDAGWGEWVGSEPRHRPGSYQSYSFHCPPEHLAAIYESGRWVMGS